MTTTVKHIISESDQHFSPGNCPEWLYKVVQANVCTALSEDSPGKDLSTRVVKHRTIGEASIVSNETAVIAGLFWVNEVFNQIQADISVEWYVKDGQSVNAEQQLCTIKGQLASMLLAERCALNFLQTLSGTATIVARYVAQLGENGNTLISDTRKTIPGLRLAQKYAVVCGGGINHRFNLSDGILLKDNHIATHGSIAQTVDSVRKYAPDKIIEIEVRTLPQVHQALAAKVDVIMLDNFSLTDISKAVAIISGRVKVEVSGNLKLEDIKTVAGYDVDYISIGALTKHLHAIDMSMKVKPPMTNAI